VGATPSTSNFRATGPRWSEIADFEPIFARSASALTPDEKKYKKLINFVANIPHTSAILDGKRPFCAMKPLIYRACVISIENGRFCPNGASLAQTFRYKWSSRTNHSSYEKTR